MLFKLRTEKLPAACAQRVDRERYHEQYRRWGVEQIGDWAKVRQARVLQVVKGQRPQLFIRKATATAAAIGRQRGSAAASARVSGIAG